MIWRNMAWFISHCFVICAWKSSKFICISIYRQCCLVHFAANCSNWKMSFRKPVATTWKMNENQFRQMFLIPWHMLSHIRVHFGLWRPISMVKIWFSHIFPASAWSPYQSLFLRHEIEKGLRAVYRRAQFNVIILLSASKHALFPR